MGASVAFVVVLLVAGLVLFLLEMITPTFGLLAVAGVAALVGATWVAYTISPTAGIAVGVGVLLAIPGYWYLLIKFVPNSPLGRKVFLRDAEPGQAGAGTPEATGLKALVGRQAVTESVLRPSGVIRVDGRRVTALAEYGMIDRDAPVRIVRVSGMSVVVRALKPEDVTSPSEAGA